MNVLLNRGGIIDLTTISFVFVGVGPLALYVIAAGYESNDGRPLW